MSGQNISSYRTKTKLEFLEKNKNMLVLILNDFPELSLEDVKEKIDILKNSYIEELQKHEKFKQLDLWSLEK